MFTWLLTNANINGEFFPCHTLNPPDNRCTERAKESKAPLRLGLFVNLSMHQVQRIRGSEAEKGSMWKLCGDDGLSEEFSILVCHSRS